MKLTDNIHLLRIDFEIAISPDKKLPRFVNVILIIGEKITLIDTGVKGSEQLIFDYIKSINRNPAEIETIILSHSHPDHIGSAAKIKEITGCKVIAHVFESAWIENIDIQFKKRPVPGFYNLVDQSVVIDKLIFYNQDLTIDKNIHVNIIHAPGHSKGSINLLFVEDKLFFTADSIPLKNDIPNYDNFPDLMWTLNSIKYQNDYNVMLSSWTPPISEKTEIERLIHEGEEYMKMLNHVVQLCYKDKEEIPLSFCKSALNQLGLPPFLAVPVVDNAFRSHLIENNY